MLRKVFSSIFFVTILFHNIYGANILFLFGGGNYSHKMSIWPLVEALVSKGHNVTFVSSIPRQPKIIPGVTDLTPTFLKQVSDGVYDVDRIKNRITDKQKRFSSPYESIALKVCSETMTSRDDPVFTNVIENGKFDLAVINSVYGDCGFFIAHHLGSKVIVYDSTTIYNWLHGIFGLPLETSWIPDLLSIVDYPMTFWTRLQVQYSSYLFYRNSQSFENDLRELYKNRFGLTHAPSLVELQRNASLVLVNSHYSIDYARALSPMFVNIGGMALWEPEGVLPTNFKKFMDSYEEGVILISFGSTVKFNSLSEQYLSMFFNTMKKFDKTGFIWRWEGPLPDNHPKNLLAEKWLPQRAILREKSVRALMSHGGINSIQEATYHGIPIIAMPLFADQDFQAHRVQAQEIGVRLEAATLSQEDLEVAFWKVLNNPQYKRNMMIRSKLFRDRPNPVQTATEALEFVLRHDDLSPLKPMNFDQSFWVRQNVDIYVFVFLTTTLVSIIIPIFIFWIYCKFC